MNKDTATAVLDRVIFNFTVIIVQTDNAFFQYVIKGIVVYLNILMVSADQLPRPLATFLNVQPVISTFFIGVPSSYIFGNTNSRHGISS